MSQPYALSGAQMSSTFDNRYVAANAIDNLFTTVAATQDTNPPANFLSVAVGASVGAMNPVGDVYVYNVSPRQGLEPSLYPCAG
jgi:hypothetical protein